jgi:protein-disulfide isomerase
VQKTVRAKDSSGKSPGAHGKIIAGQSIYRIAPVFLFDYADAMKTNTHSITKQISRRHLLATGLAATMMPSVALAETDIIAHVKAPRLLGRDDAPIQVIEFFSMTCSHCASFHANTFPEVKTRLIDEGVVRFEMRAFPLDGLALRAHAMARTVSSEKYYPLVNMLLEKQTSWANAADPIDALRKLGRLAGMSSAEFDATMRNRPLLESIVQMRQDAVKDFDVKATPSFVINNETTISGSLSFEEFAEKINATVT